MSYIKKLSTQLLPQQPPQEGGYEQRTIPGCFTHLPVHGYSEKFENAKANAIRIAKYNMYSQQKKREKKKENIAVQNPMQMRLCKGSDPTQRQVQIVQTTR
jgi:hypothetical protein